MIKITGEEDIYQLVVNTGSEYLTCVRLPVDENQVIQILKIILPPLSGGYFCLRILKNTLMDTSKEKPFFPSGAIAFFVALVILALLFWYSIYFLMIERT